MEEAQALESCFLERCKSSATKWGRTSAQSRANLKIKNKWEACYKVSKHSWKPVFCHESIRRHFRSCFSISCFIFKSLGFNYKLKRDNQNSYYFPCTDTTASARYTSSLSQPEKLGNVRTTGFYIKFKLRSLRFYRQQFIFSRISIFICSSVI